MADQFPKGATVRLKSGGVVMKVVETAHGQCLCKFNDKPEPASQWFTPTLVESLWFDEDKLELVPHFGDYGVLARADGAFDVFKVTVSDDRETRREKLPELQTAYEIARAGLENDGGTTVWYVHHSEPDAIKPYKV